MMMSVASVGDRGIEVICLRGATRIRNWHVYRRFEMKHGGQLLVNKLISLHLPWMGSLCKHFILKMDIFNFIL